MIIYVCSNTRRNNYFTIFSRANKSNAFLAAKNTFKKNIYIVNDFEHTRNLKVDLKSQCLHSVEHCNQNFKITIVEQFCEFLVCQLLVNK